MDKISVSPEILEHVYVAIIAGGEGTRLYPISNSQRSKPYCMLNKDYTFIQRVVETYIRLGIKPSHIIVTTTNENQTRLAIEQVTRKGVLSQNVHQIPNLGYPAAMYLATKFISSLDPDAIVISTPADQYIVVNDEFSRTIEAAVYEAVAGSATIVGVKINDLNTAMGCGHAIYDEIEGAADCFDVIGFVEKPGREEADRIMRQGNSACNTGINVWRANTLFEAISESDIAGMSTDQMMGRFEGLRVAVGRFEWHDCGTLKSLYDVSEKTPNHRNASIGGGKFERTDCSRCLLYAEEGMELRLTGGEDVAAVFTTIDSHPIVVVVKMSESQRVRALAEDYKLHKEFLTDDFAFGARNNIVLRSNVDDLIVGFVEVEGYAVYVHRESDGSMIAAVSLQKTR